MVTFDTNDFDSPEGREKILSFLYGLQETLNDLIHANQDKLIEMGKAYAKPENLDVQ